VGRSSPFGALRDIASKTIDGVVPTGRALARMDDEAAIEQLTTVRGVGRWTAEILLIRAGRPDVMPADDFGLRSGFGAAHGGAELPTPRALRAFAERWRPPRSVAAWYLWRARIGPAPACPRPSPRRRAPDAEALRHDRSSAATPSSSSSMRARSSGVSGSAAI
jgi:3-methyladenine DNA glycosylase/8-oxoguanine DNA glycosylase